MSPRKMPTDYVKEGIEYLRMTLGKNVQVIYFPFERRSKKIKVVHGKLIIASGSTKEQAVAGAVDRVISLRLVPK